MQSLIEKSTDCHGNWSPKGTQRDPKIEELGGQFGHPPLDLPRGQQMEPKWSQNGPRMEPKWNKNEAKWTQNGPNMELTGPQMDPEWNQNGLKIEPYIMIC